MNRIEREATINSLTNLESYYQSRYEYYLAMATEAKENRERVGLLLLDLGRDVLTSFGSEEASHLAKDIQKTGREQNRETPQFSIDERVNFELPQTNSLQDLEESAIAVVDQESLAPSVSQMKEWTLSLAKAMSIIELVSNSDSGKALHQNYLHHVIDREFEQKLSPELIELYLEEAIRRGYLELDEFDNNCYRGKPKKDSNSEVSIDRSNMDSRDGEVWQSAQLPTIEPLDSNVASDRSSKSPTLTIAKHKANNREQSRIKIGKPYDLPESDKLKSTLGETIEGYIALNHPKRFSIDDVINYLYPQNAQLNWDKDLKNKIRNSIFNVLSRKAYLGKRWTRVKVGVYQPLTSKR